MKYGFIAIEGNIGSGKTTLAGRLAVHYQAKSILEQFADNPFLPRFYEDKERYALPLELSFLTDRYHQLKEAFDGTAQEQQLVVADYTIIKTQLFARTNLNEDEFALFQRLTQIIKTNLPKPDLLIYLHAPVSKLQQQIRKRGRSYEQNITDDYLISIDQAYEHYLAQEDVKTLIVDTAVVDFNSDVYFDRLTAILASDDDFTEEGFSLK